jgi:L-alanine-DL-glutamate epimerase-like enolase superfamily enzyme
MVHDLGAHFLLGSSPLDVEVIWDLVFSWTNSFGYAGAEMRGLAAVDIALWDIQGQYLGQPIYNLLGGMCRDRMRVYNACVNGGSYTDYTDVLERPAELARSLCEQCC